ncbi:MAG: putative ABC transporter permease subunit [Desulfurivibrionaceae bacterium]
MRLILLKPFWYSLRNRFFPGKGGLSLKSLAVAVFCLVLCVVIYQVSLKSIGYFHSQSQLGIILSLKIFQMAWIIIFAMLVFSCLVSAVSSLFLSQDNEIIFSAPVTPESLYFMRFVTITAQTSWMMVLFSLPVFTAFGQIFKGGILYLPLMLFALVSVALTAVGIGLIITIILVNLFPARNTKDIVFYLSLCFAVFLYIIIRLIRPEELANPESFGSFINYLSGISGPAGPFVPGGWAADFLTFYLRERTIDWLLLALLTVTPLSLFFCGEWLMRAMFFPGYTKAQESFGGYRKFGGRRRYLPSPVKWLLRKEFKTFLRDSGEWSQLFMIGALVAVYLYNFKVLPVERGFWEEEYLTNLISFLNIGLTGFVITSLAARFVFPSIGAEGGAFFIIRSSPLSIGRFVFWKFVFYSIPLTILSVILVLVSDYLLKIQGPIWWISLAVTTVMTPIITALALGFGMIYADFKSESKAAAIGSWGAVIFLLTSLTLEGLVLCAGGYPSYLVTRKWLAGVSMTASDILALLCWAVFSLLLSAGLLYYFLKKGVNRLSGCTG